MEEMPMVTPPEMLEPPKKDKKEKKEKEVKKELLTYEKLLLAYERTHIAWIKAATHLLIFGFAIYKLLEEKIMEPGTHPLLEILTPRRIGLVLFFGGFLGLLMATIRSVQVQKKYGNYTWKYHFSAIMLLAYVILLMLFVLFIGTMSGK
jgi:uncharacterized membrane protein YidH (DUF202 family)